MGYICGAAFLVIAALKPIFPQNVGVLFINGMPAGFGAHFPVPPGATIRGGYWIVPAALMCGLGVLVGTHRGARKLLARWRDRRSGAL